MFGGGGIGVGDLEYGLEREDEGETGPPADAIRFRDNF